MNGAGRGFWSGAGGGCAFVAVSLLARAIFRVPTLPELLQDRLVLSLPGPLFAFVLEHLLYLGKPLLFVSLLLALVVLCGLLGMASARWGRPLGVGLLLWLAVGLLILPAMSAGPFAGSPAVALTTLVAAAAWVVAYCLFAGRWPLSPSDGKEAAVSERGSGAQTLDRRRLIAGGALGLVTAGLAWRSVGTLPTLPPRTGGAEPEAATAVDASSPLAVESAAGGLPPAITPADRFYVVSKNLLDPELKQANWSLRIGGLVEHALTLHYGDMAALPPVRLPRTLECVSNNIGGDLISNGEWMGTPLSGVLARAGVLPSATHLLFTCADDYTSALTLAQGQDAATLLVYQLDGAPLTSKHGFPVRLLTTGIYGMKNPKWVTQIELASANRAGFWQQQGWDDAGVVQTMSEITSPAEGATVGRGAITIGGVAFAGARGIQRVEVSSDGGSRWSDARILPPLGANTWVFWQFAWQPAATGGYSLLVRATDGGGMPQTARRTDPFPDGATGYHQIRVRVA